jgi:AcrR family transcriptional regulator
MQGPMARTLDTTKRAAILRSARKLFKRDGYDAAKITDIANDVGIAVGTLYLYFESKEALALAIIEEFFARLANQFEDIALNLNGPQSLVTLIDWAMQIVDSESDILAIATSGGPSPMNVSSGRQVIVSRLSTALSTLIKLGVIRTYKRPDLVADLVFSIIRQVVQSCQASPDNRDDLRTTSIIIIQHALFPDQTIAVERFLEARNELVARTNESKKEHKKKRH